MTWIDHTSRRAAAIAFLFGHGLGVSTVVLPLLALANGYGASAVGVFVAISGVGQIGMRILLTRVFHRLPERQLVVAAAVLLFVSSGIVLLSLSLSVFIAAHLMQGIGRGLFWVGLQAHVVGTADDSLRPLAVVDFMSGIGLVAGAVTIGLTGGSLTGTLAVGMAATVLSLVPSSRLAPLPAVRRTVSPAGGTIWRRPGLDAAVLGAVSTGAWRGLLNSYVPVVLTGAGHSASMVGLLVGVGSATSIAGSAIAGLTVSRRLRVVFVAATLGTGFGLVGAGLWPASLAVVGLCLMGSGVGAGVLQTLSPALGARAVGPDERGRVVTEIGTYRAVALLGSPLGVAALLLVSPVGPALALVGILTAVPALARWSGGTSRRSR